jgi:hypothetical protein
VKDAAPRSVWFDPQRRAATLELQAIIKSLSRFLEDREAALAIRRRSRRDIDQRSFHLAIECIACNLAGLILTGLDRPLAVPRSSSVMWPTGRYRVPVYGQHFVDTLDLMAHPGVGLIESLELGYRFAGGGKRQSTVKPTQAFIARVRPALCGWEAFSRAEGLFAGDRVRRRDNPYRRSTPRKSHFQRYSLGKLAPARPVFAQMPQGQLGGLASEILHVIRS